MQELDVTTITKRTVHGIFALISRTFLLSIISFVASLVIFSKLTPYEVGTYGAVIAIQRIISFFTDFGFGAALIQKKEEATNEDIATMFTLQTIITFAIFIIGVLLSPYIVDFFKLSQEAKNLLIVLVFTIFLSSFKTIPSILLERKIHFKRLVIPQIVESFIFNILLIILLFAGFRLTSYTAAFLISALISIPFYYIANPWKISLGISKASLSHLKFGLQFQAKSILATIKDDFLTVILAKFLTFTELGYIVFSQRLAFFVYRYIVDSVTKVTFSTYSRIQEDKELLKTTIEKSLFYIALCMFPMLFGLAIVSPYLIHYFPSWQNKWEPAVLSLIFFALNAAVSSISGVLVNVLDSTGRVKTTLKMMALWTVLTWTLTPLLIYLYGYNGVAIASFFVTTTVIITGYIVKKIVPVSYMKSLLKPALATCIMSVFVYAMAKLVISDLLTLAFVILLGGVIYLLCIYYLAGDEVRKGFVALRRK